MSTNAFIDRTGQMFGRWTILSYARSNSIGRIWLCRCECGTEREVLWASLSTGASQSCGCAKQIFIKTHGLSKTKQYGVWKSMIGRCENPTDQGYDNYGGRGIKVCERWRMSYENFLADMGPRPSDDHSVDRYPDQNGNYEPGNVRWALVKEQNRNKRDNHLITFRGETKTMVDWAESLGMGYSALRNRINVYKWSIEDALTIPVGEAPAPTEGTSKQIFVDHAGEQHNYWTVISYSHFAVNNGRMWVCRCKCGTEKTVPYSQLKNGKSKSCGCFRNHGQSKTSLYATWIQMIDRCENPNNRKYPACGAKGIKVSPEWRASFDNMRRDMGERPSENHMLCRLDTGKDYSKENCAWMTPQEEKDRHSHSTLVEFRGEKRTYKEWAEITDIPASTIEQRLRMRGWSIEEALLRPKNYRPTSLKNQQIAMEIAE